MPGVFPFLTALHDPARIPVIAEVKLCDPDGRDLTGGRAPEAIARDYARRGAAALSVVTGRWFGGTADLARRIAAADTGLPILRKDFLTSVAALDESRVLGVQAVLLTAALSKQRLPALIEAALIRGLTPFVEITTEAEAALVPAELPCVIAVNNADIATCEREGPGPARALALAAAVAARRPAACVAASRIHDAATARALLEAGFDALLIGTAAMHDPALIDAIGARTEAPAPLSEDLHVP